MSETQPTPWQLVADEVLAVMVHDLPGYELARYEHGVMIDHFPPGHYRNAVRAIDALCMAGKPAHITTVHTDSGVPLDWLSDRYALSNGAASKLVGSVLAENVRRLKDYGAAYYQRDVMQWGADALVKAETPEQRAEVLSTVITRLGLDMSEDVAEATAEKAAVRFETMLNAEPLPVLTTGIPELDAVTGGLGRGQIWWIAAAYKRRKSTLLRIMALALSEAGISVTILALEGTQEQWIADFVAMLAVRWLHANGHWEKSVEGIPLHAISSTLLLTWRNGYKKLTPLKVRAISEGIKAYKALGNNLRIYDRQPENGGLGTLASAQTLINRDVARYGAAVVFVDHVQLIDAGRQTEFENVTLSARTLQGIAASKNIALVVLAQLNEETVKYSGRSISPGIKGGGAPAATADFIIRTGYPKLNETGDEDKTRLEISVGWARRGSEGAVLDFKMHPATGWLIPTHKVDVTSYVGYKASPKNEERAAR